MKACCYGFSSCTTCPECGSRITGERPYASTHPDDVDKALRVRPSKGDLPDRAWQESSQEDYYDGRDDE